MADCLPLAVPFAGVVYRIASSQWCSPDHLFSGGSPRTGSRPGGGSWYNGGRWNPPGLASGTQRPSRTPRLTWLLNEGFRTVYTSLKLETAVAEVLWHAKQGSLGLPLQHTYWDDRMVGKAGVKFSRVLDMTDAMTLARLKVHPRDLRKEWAALQDRGLEVITQLLGRAARYHGFEGIRCPSARDRPKGVNLVIFPDNCEDKKWLESLVVSKIPPGSRRF
jgi:RES domain-containing protein